MSRADWFSVRMRAATGGSHESGGRHLSGAERLVPAEEVEIASADLLRRALQSGADADFVRITIDRVPIQSIARAEALHVITDVAPDAVAARRRAAELLVAAGVSPAAVEAAFNAITRGAAVREGVADNPNSADSITRDAATRANVGLDPNRTAVVTRGVAIREGANLEQSITANVTPWTAFQAGATNDPNSADAITRDAATQEIVGLDPNSADDGGRRPAMRGAALMDCNTGERLEPDTSRGVRVTRMDYADRNAAARQLAAAGLGHHRTLEALAVATKAIWCGVIAELCWSDSPDYVAGYVASAAHGYIRFARFKPDGTVGGRVFFVDSRSGSVPDLIVRLERSALLIENPATPC